MLRPRRLLIYLCCCALHALALPIDGTVDSPWPCPADSPCWMLPALNEFIVDLAQVLAPLWACPSCMDYVQPQCIYGDCPMGLRQCTGITAFDAYACYPCDPSALLANNRVYGAGLLASCQWHNLSVCGKGYYAPPFTDAGDDGTPCVPCLDVPATCGAGLHARRCITDLADACRPCALPALPANDSSLQYGPGRLFDDCSVIGTNRNDASATFSGCAFFLTPKWELGYCDVYCRAGYALTARAAAGWLLPTCTPCATAGPPGWTPPVCGGGYTRALQSPACQPCDAQWLPSNASWVAAWAGGPNCPWACTTGFYVSGGDCAPCGHGLPCADGQYWLGCGGNSPGECRTCDASACTAGRTFLLAAPYAETCACAPCARAALGVTYASALCTPRNDTRLRPCAACAGDQYLARACTLTLDTLCLPCTPPALGRLLLSPCNATADAAYAACPPGYACDGSYALHNCTVPHVARDGLCACPLATVEPDCAPRACPPAYYPDAADGGCKPCAARMTSDSVALAASRAGYVGFDDACGCVPGYLRAASGRATTCWPCGDLVCLVGAEMQTACDGFGDADPACLCGVGPGMSLRPNTTLDEGCVLQCADSFFATAPTLTPDAYSDYGFVSGLTAPWPPAPSQAAPVCPGAPIATTAPLDGGATLLVLCGDGTLALQTPDAGGATFVPPLEPLFSEPEIRASIAGVDLAVHTQEPGARYAWFLFRFWGLCGDELDRKDDGTAVNRWCLAVELLAVVRGAASSLLCGSGLCLYMGANQWGALFPGYGLAGSDGALAWAPSLQSPAGALFILASVQAQQLLFRCDIAFYSDDAVRAPDYPLAQVLALSGAPRRLAFFIDTLLVWPRVLTLVAADADAVWRVDGCVTQHAAPCTVRAWADGPPSTPLRAVRASAALLFLQDQRAIYTLDPWNALVSPPRALPSRLTHGDLYVWGALTTEGALLLALNGSHLWLLPNAAPCPPDTFASSASAGGCAPMPCTRCGRGTRAMVRGVGNTTCGCAPGFALASGGRQCVACAPPMYCPGGDDPPTPCDDPHAVTLSPQATAADCVCLPGHYLFAGTCVRCPVGLWCPVHGTIAPVACAGYGSTLTDGALSPLECACPARTHHFACVACDDRDVCMQPVWPRPTLSALVWASDPRACLAGYNDDGNQLVYSVRGVSPLAAAAQWVSVHRALTDAELANASACAGGAAPAALVPPAAVSYVLPDRCEGRHLEWDGATGCTCVGGYETVDTGLYGLRCLPCLNGTMRPRLAPGGCIPCLASALQEAPYLGMTACACIAGYEPDAVTGACVSVDARTRAPAWFATASDANFLLLYVGVGASAAALGFAALLGVLLMG